MMRLPRPASPRALWKDVRDFAGQRRSHRWVAALLAVAIPVGILIIFMFDYSDAHHAPEQVIYVESWRADRSIAESRAAILALEERRKAGEEARRQQFQHLENGLNSLGLD